MATRETRLNKLEGTISPDAPVPFLACYPPEGEDWPPEFMNMTTGELLDKLPPNAEIIARLGVRASLL